MSHTAPEPAPADADKLLTLPQRRVLFVASILVAVAAPLVAVQLPEYGAALWLAQSTLSTAAGGVALANPTRRP